MVVERNYVRNREVPEDLGGFRTAHLRRRVARRALIQLLKLRLEGELSSEESKRRMQNIIEAAGWERSPRAADTERCRDLRGLPLFNA